MLTLPIKSKWFNMIVSGEKKEEYRAINDYYASRFNKLLDENNQFWCVLRNGYSASSPSVTVHVKLSIGYGNPDWGAEPNEQYYVLSIIDIKE